MSAGSSNTETEIKLRISDVDKTRRLLYRLGFRVVRRRVRELNWVFDTAGGDLRGRGELLRLRQAGRRYTLTFKGPSFPGRHKTREEYEVQVSDTATAERILGELGFTLTFRYEKYRTEYARHGRRGLVTLDETPIGEFLELEGTGPWIDRTARQFGFSVGDYVTVSYGALFQQHRRHAPEVPKDMVFPYSPQSGRS